MRVLAVDWGEKRLGFAVSDEEGIVAFPLDATGAVGDAQKIEAVSSRIRETGALRVIIGLPLTLAGIEGEAAAAVRRFAQRVKARVDAEVILWDERFTTDIVEKGTGWKRCNRPRRKKRRRKEKDASHAEAAALLLQSYLDFMNRERS